MKKIVFAIVVTAALAFCLGYLLRGSLDRSPANPQARTQITTPRPSSGPETTTATRAEQDDGSAPTALRSNLAPTREAIEITNRKSRERIKRDRLADFFAINGIGEQRAEEIIQGLVEADYRLNQEQQALFDQHTAEKAEQIARGDMVAITLTPGERAAFDAKLSSAYREVIGEYYEAYESYERSYLQRRIVNHLSSNFAEPLDYAAKETLILIMHEEQSRLEIAVKDRLAGRSEQAGGQIPEWSAAKDRHYARIDDMRSYNERVISRARPYLSAEHLAQLRTLLGNEIRKMELLIELNDLDE